MKPLVEPPPDPVAKPVRATDLFLAAYAGAVHLALAEDRYNLDAHYVGALFVAAAMGAILGTAVAAGGDRFGTGVVWASWAVAVVSVLGMFVGFLLSRTVGLPGYHRTDWPVIQVIALFAEAGVVALCAVAVRQHLARRTAEAEPAGAPARVG